MAQSQAFRVEDYLEGEHYTLPPNLCHTTHHQMLSTDILESLRQNLLWEHQVNGQVIVALRALLASMAPVSESWGQDGTNEHPSTLHKDMYERTQKEVCK